MSEKTALDKRPNKSAKTTKAKKAADIAAKEKAAEKAAALAAKQKLTPRQRIRASGVWLVKSIAKLTLGLLLGLVIYLIYLDAKVTSKFEGRKWQIPAQIYAKPLILQQGLKITKAELVQELEFLNYRKAPKLSGAGQYLVSKNHLSLVRRPFDFPGRSAPAQGLIVEFANQKIASVIDRKTQKRLNNASLEPLLIERLLSPHQEDREFLPIDAFPEEFKDTLLLVEDRDFYHHFGVSLTATARALWQNLKAGRTVQGGSTLTQQLAKNFYLNHDRNLVRKINEAFIALLLDYRYGKDQILEAYVNEVFLGQFHNRAIHGFGLASYYYFSKPINELHSQEFAVLVAIIKGPSYYNPHRHPERTLKRRDLILRLMFEHHLLDKNEYETAVGKPLGVSAKKQFLPLRYPAYMAQVKRDLKSTIRDSDIFSDGIRVFTNLEPRLQRASEQVIVQQLPLMEAQYKIEKVEAVSVSVDYSEAAITAMVGARDVNFSGFNRALDMKRNIGSLIKPAIYLQALSSPDDYNLATPLKDEPITLLNRKGKKWSPANFSKTHEGQVPLLQALARSKNVPTVNLGMALGVSEVSEGLRALGVDAKIPQYPSLFLGALELSPLQVSQMYATIADNGVHKKLSTLRAVTTAQGELIWNRAVTARANFSIPAIYLTNVALKEAASTGTARRLKQVFPGVVFAGKTGTTDELRDSWFTGFDANNLTTFWVGKDDYSSVGLTGSQGALRLFSELYKIIPPQTLLDARPQGITDQFFQPDTGKRFETLCEGGVTLPGIDSKDPVVYVCQ